MRKVKLLPLVISVLLVVQLVFPIVSVYAATAQAPNNFKVSERYPGSLVFDWDAVAGATAYKLYKIDGETKTLVSQVTTNKAYATVKEGTFTYAVSAIVSGQESLLSISVSIQVVYPVMQPPANAHSTIERFYDLTLSWEASSYVHYYKIYQVIDGVRKLVTTTENLSYKLTTMPEGHYVYEVTAYNSIFGESQPSRMDVDIVYPIMQAPGTVAYTVANGNDITITWSKADYANKYNIYEVTDAGKNLVASSTSLSATLSKVTEGKHLYEVTSYSYTFKESKSGTQISVNLINPDFKAPQNLSFSISNGNDGTLSWNTVDYANYYKVYQIIDGSKVFLKQVNFPTISFQNMAEGNYIYEVTAYSDRFGEESPATRLEQQVIFPDMQKPEKFNASVLNVNTLYLKWDKAQYADFYKLYQVINGERVFVKDIDNTYTALNDLAEGNYIYEITSYSNRFGESGESSHIQAEIIYPEVPARFLQGFANQEANSIALWWDEADYATTYDVYQVKDGIPTLINSTPNTRIAFNNMSEGEYTYEVIAHTKFGDSPVSNRVTVAVEPELPAPVDPDAAVNGDDVTLTWDEVKGAESYNVYKEVDGKLILVGNTTEPSLTINDLEPGEYTYVIVPVSETGKESSSSSTIVVSAEDFDTVAPVTVSDVSEDWYRGEATVELMATDDKSGVAKTFYSFNGTDFVEGTVFTVPNEGINQVSFYSVDNAGNKEEVKTAEVKLDRTAPETVSNITDNWNQNDVTVQLAAVDFESGVAKTFYSVNGSEYVEGKVFTIADDGINKVTFYSVDNAGNVEEVKTAEVKIDRTAPETTSNIEDKWSQDDVAVELTATDSASGVAKTFYSVNGSEFTEGKSFTVTEEGINKVEFYSVDNAGNVEEVKTAEVKIDRTAPETGSNIVDQWNKDDVAGELTATDSGSGVAKTFYSVNGSEFTEGKSFTVTEEGINKVTFYSVDNAGNVEEVKTAEVKIDRTAPETTSNIVDRWNKDKVAVELTATDSGSGVAKTFYSVNGSEFTEGKSFTVTEEGMNKVEFYSIDKAGNVEETKSAEVKVDKTLPVVNWDLKNEYAKGSVLPGYTVADSVSGVETVTVTVNGQNVSGPIKLDKPGTYNLVLTATDKAGWTTTLTKTVAVYVPVTIEVNPGIIKGNKGIFTVQVKVPCGTGLGNVDLGTATLNGVSAKSGSNGLQQQANNGQFKFEREDFDWKPGTLDVEFRAVVNGYLIVGTTTVKVK